MRRSGSFLSLMPALVLVQVAHVWAPAQVRRTAKMGLPLPSWVRSPGKTHGPGDSLLWSRVGLCGVTDPVGLRQPGLVQNSVCSSFPWDESPNAMASLGSEAL